MWLFIPNWIFHLQGELSGLSAFTPALALTAEPFKWLLPKVIDHLWGRVSFFFALQLAFPRFRKSFPKPQENERDVWVYLQRFVLGESGSRSEYTRQRQFILVLKNRQQSVHS